MYTITIIVTPIAGLVGLVGYFWLLFKAFRESKFCGFLFIFVPLYNLYYPISRFKTCWPGFILYLAGGTAASLMGQAVLTLNQTT